MSLAAGAFGFDAIPVRLIEALVAASILVAAVHALRPLFPQREWIVAGGFGLIHGLAFSQTLAAMQRRIVASILGVGLLIVAAVLYALDAGGPKLLTLPVSTWIAGIGGLWALLAAWPRR